MKKVLFAAAIMFCLTLLSSQDSNAQALGFYIDNNTGFTLNNIYVAPSESAKWGDDILPKDLFDNGTQVEVSIPATYGETCMFDIKITDLEGAAVIFTNVDACKLHTLKINGDGTYEVTNVK